MRIESNRWVDVCALPAGVFRRLTGVSVETFARMVEVVEQAETAKIKPGRPPRLCCQDRVRLCLEYLRDDPTYLRLGVNWGLSERAAKRLQNQVEDLLIQHHDVHLPGRRRRLDAPTLDVVVVDVSERPVERPKKSSGAVAAARNVSTP